MYIFPRGERAERLRQHSPRLAAGLTASEAICSHRAGESPNIISIAPGLLAQNSQLNLSKLAPLESPLSLAKTSYFEMVILAPRLLALSATPNQIIQQTGLAKTALNVLGKFMKEKQIEMR